MSTGSTVAPRADPVDETSPDRLEGWGRWLGPAATAVGILPIWVAAIRLGLQGSFPNADAAETVLRARDVFGGPFPLVGMPAAASSSDGVVTYFPGPWQLYVLSVPTEIFGSVWGPVLAMAALNSVWFGLAAWLLFRRLRPAEALVGVGFLAALLWAIGSGFLVTPVPMDMVIIPMALFLVSVWAVADGDLVALPVAALVTNYLWLDHLVLVVTVPVVALCAPVGLWFWYRRTRSKDPQAAAEQRRRLRRSLLAAGIITVVMWVPTLIEQFTSDPGNLRELTASVGGDRPTVGSWFSALHVVLSVVARPMFWLRGTFDAPAYLRPPIGGELIDDFAVYDLIAGLVLAVLGVVLVVGAVRRRDSTGLWLLIVAGVALAVSVVTTQAAPAYFSTPTGYLRALWATAMFVWFAVALNLIRWFGAHLRSSLLVPAGALLVVVTVANLPAKSGTLGTERHIDWVVATMNDTVVPRFDGDEPVRVVTALGFDSHRFGAALKLALRDASVPFCLPEGDLSNNSKSQRGCPEGVDRAVSVIVLDDPDRSLEGELLVHEPLLDESERAELARLNARIDAWLDGRDRLRLTPGAREGLAGHLGGVYGAELSAVLEPRDDLGPLLDQPGFPGMLRLWYGQSGSPGPLFEDDPLSAVEWRRWQDLTERDQYLYVTEVDLTRTDR